VCAIPAAIQQQKFSPITKNAPAEVRIEWARVFIVALILLSAILANVIANLRYPELLEAWPLIGMGVWGAILATAPLRAPDWHVLPETFQGTIFLLALVTCASMMPVEKLPLASWQTTLGLGFISAVFDNIPLTALALKQGGYDCGGFRRLDDLVWLLCRRGARQRVPERQVDRTLVARWLARDRCLRGGVLRHAGRARLAPRSATPQRHGAADPARRRRPAQGLRPLQDPCPIRACRQGLRHLGKAPCAPSTCKT